MTTYATFDKANQNILFTYATTITNSISSCNITVSSNVATSNLTTSFLTAPVASLCNLHIAGQVSGNVPYTNENIVQNPEFTIWQRGTTISGTSSINQYTADRWIGRLSGTPPAGTLSSSISQYADATYGSAVSLSMAVSGAAYFGLENAYVEQRLEGNDVISLNEEQVTVSFLYKSSWSHTSNVVQLVGTNNSYSQTQYFASTANTWARQTLTFPVISGLAKGTGHELSLFIGAQKGSSYQTGGTSATIYITRVKMERGTNATAFSARPMAQEVQLCQRYLEKPAATSYNVLLNTGASTGNYTIHTIPWKTLKATTPNTTVSGSITNSTISGSATFGVDTSTTEIKISANVSSGGQFYTSVDNPLFSCEL